MDHKVEELMNELKGSQSDITEKFLDAQETSYNQALSEIRGGEKQSCWMWYVFPQLTELGRSFNARYYGIDNIEDARKYYAHPVLGARLVEICEALLSLDNNNATLVMHRPDDKKLKSSMTLFSEAIPNQPVFQKVLDKFFRGEKDFLTLEILERQAHESL